MSEGNPNIAECGKNTQIKPGQRLPGAGRKPSKLRKYIKENNLSSQDFTYIFENIISSKSVDEIKNMVKTGKDSKGRALTALIWGFCMAWIADCKRGLSAGGIFAQLQDRKHGKPIQPVVSDINLKNDASSIPPAEREAAFKQALKDMVKKDPDLVRELLKDEEGKNGKS